MRYAVMTLAAALLWGCVAEEKATGPGLQTTAVAVDPNVIVIGVAGPMTGQNAPFGMQLRNGAEQAVADINAAGGVGGKRLRLEIGDDGCDPKRAVAVANMLVAKGAAMIDGHFCSSSSIPASAVYAASGAVMITPASTNWRLTIDAAQKGWTHVFRTHVMDDSQGAFAGRWIARNWRGQRLAIVHDDSSFASRIAAEVKRTANAAGMTEFLNEQIRQGAGAGGALVQRIITGGADVVYFGGYHADAASLIKMLRSAGSRAVLVGPDSLVDEVFWRASGPAGQGVVMTFAKDPRRHPSAQPLVSAFKARGIDPEGYTLMAYAAVQAWSEAARRTGSLDRNAIATTLRNGRFDTVLGPIAFDRSGDLVDQPWALYVWNNGAYGELAGGS